MVVVEKDEFLQNRRMLLGLFVEENHDQEYKLRKEYYKLLT